MTIDQGLAKGPVDISNMPESPSGWNRWTTIPASSMCCTISSTSLWYLLYRRAAAADAWGVFTGRTGISSSISTMQNSISSPPESPARASPQPEPVLPGVACADGACISARWVVTLLAQSTLLVRSPVHSGRLSVKTSLVALNRVPLEPLRTESSLLSVQHSSWDFARRVLSHWLTVCLIYSCDCLE
jgi:hypothetical protein